MNPARRAKEWARAYGSLERVFYINNHLSCVVETCVRTDLQNAHIETGGMSRKADADKIVPMCSEHHALHHTGAETFVECYGLDLQAMAAETERLWQLNGADVVARAKADGRFQRWLDRDKEAA